MAINEKKNTNETVQGQNDSLELLLLSLINEDSVHSEIDYCRVEGKEIW